MTVFIVVVSLSFTAVLTQYVDGQTSVTDMLNEMIAPSDNGYVYYGGKGVIVRNPIDGLPDSLQTLPATFWSNDIITPSQLYPVSIYSGDTGNVDCPSFDGWNGFWDIEQCDDGPWWYASLGYVIGSSMNEVMYDFDNIQTDDWGWGVFYASDSNSVDFRCHWSDQYDGFDCPGGWLASDGSWSDDSSKLGTGAYPAGNPYADDSWGGGAGCHRDKGDSDPANPSSGRYIDQTDAPSDGLNLVSDYFCQCDYTFADDWSHWVWQWVNYATPKPQGVDKTTWLGQNGVLAPSRALDMSACWMNNPRDMIGLQNQLYWLSDKWSNQLAPASQRSDDPQSYQVYWGWNEVPIGRDVATNAELWDAVMIKLPAALCGGDVPYAGGDDTLWCLADQQQLALQKDLHRWVEKGFLIPGADSISSRPGSYMVLAREWVDEDYNWQRFFFCENFEGSSYNIVYKDSNDGWGDGGVCFLDYSASPTPSPSPSPAPCQVGDAVQCPTGEMCAGSQCCTDLSTCPSAGWGFTCPAPKAYDCTQ